ncbi:hypothetical protein [Pseudomonas citronellolis]|uniref:hypothetical protein n=1 Tax=Pseudomonas citronellolis TaxID=53408 RepID=UPI0023E387C7|nr:hypothetical protein [Pseudomonas citronellolis]MDF3932770.1 hypothetical protein [Pseudomonas citronellolis]
MPEELKPCKCGHSGELTGIRHKEGFLTLHCPECLHNVEAFTIEGLAERWNESVANKEDDGHA